MLSMTMTATMSSMTTSMDLSMPTSSSSHTSMGMSDMSMTFFTSTTTPLYSNAWTPTSSARYAGTCIFLIALATAFRALLAVRVQLFVIAAALKRQQHGGRQVLSDDGQKHDASDIAPDNCGRRPWKAGEAVTVAVMDVVLAGVGYLLMLAVMTMNVGYFLSVLAGVFVGSMLFGHLIPGPTGAGH